MWVEDVSFFSTKLCFFPLWRLCIRAAVFFAAVIFQSCGGLNTAKVKRKSQGTHTYTVGVLLIICRTHIVVVFRYIYFISIFILAELAESNLVDFSNIS